MENEEINLPVLSNGVATVGDLWDCRSSTFLGFNLFGKKLHVEQGNEAVSLENILKVEQNPQAGVSELIHVKNSSTSTSMLGLSAEVSAEMLGGIVKIAGGLDFEKEDSNEMSSEEIRKVIQRRTQLARLQELKFSDYEPFMDEHVKELIIQGKLQHATHIVKQVYLGGTLQGSIKIAQSKTGDKYKVGMWLSGEINLFVLSIKLDASASVGQEIRNDNYHRTITLKCMPPIDPPIDILDFAEQTEDGENNDNSITQNFTRALQGQKHFPLWDAVIEGEGERQVVGIPYEFVLVPISSILENPERPLSIPKYDKDLLIKFNSQLLLLRDFSSPDFYKKNILSKETRTQKILSDPSHAISWKVADEERKLVAEVDGKRNPAFDVYLAYKIKGEEVLAEFRQIVIQLTTFCEEKEDEVESNILRFIEEARNELEAVNVIPLDEEFEEQSPMLYFTNEIDLHNWLNSQRFCKLLYNSNFGVETDGIPQKIYEMSIKLGNLYVQPGIAYPTLTTRMASDELFSLVSPTSKISYSEEQKNKINFVLELLSATSGINSESDDYQKIVGIHLYNTYCELHGLRLDISATEDVIPLITILQDRFGSLTLAKNVIQTMDEIQNTGENEIKILLTTDGVRSSRNVMFALLAVQNYTASLNYDLTIVCGTFHAAGETKYSDNPLAFVANDGKVIAVCLDHLDVIVLLDMFKESNFLNSLQLRLLAIKDVGKNPLCSMQRVNFAKMVAGRGKKSSGMEDVDVDPDLSVRVLDGVINHRLQGYKVLADAVTAFVLNLIGNIYTNWGSVIPFWDGDNKEYKFEVEAEGSSEDWQMIAATLAWIIEDNEAGFPNYYKIKKEMIDLFAAHTVMSDPAEESSMLQSKNEDLDDEEPPPPPLTYEEQYQKAHEFIINNNWTSATLIDHVQQTRDLGELHFKPCAFLYHEAFVEESYILLEGEEREAIYMIRLLTRLINEIAQSQTPTSETLTDIVTLVVSSDDRNLGLEGFLRTSRYYHIISTLAENNPEEFKYPGNPQSFCILQKQIQKLNHSSDWVNLILLIERISPSYPIDSLRFSEETLTYIWANKKFQYLIRTNLENSFVLSSLRSAFAPNLIAKPYIPRDIAKILMYGGDGSDSDWEHEAPTKWLKIEHVLRCLRVIWVQRSVPPTFPNVLLRNVGINLENGEKPPGYNILKEKDALLFWNEKENYFEQPWDLEVIMEVLKKLATATNEGEVNVERKIKSTTPKQKKASSFSIIDSYLTLAEVANPSKIGDDDEYFQYLLFNLKHGIESDPSIFEAPRRVELLTKLFSKEGSELFSNGIKNSTIIEVLNRMSLVSPQYAIPFMIMQSADLGDLTCLHALTLSSDKYYTLEGMKGLKVITAIRFGSYSEGKSQFLNQICMINPKTFASKLDNADEIPQLLQGFVDVVKVKEEITKLDLGEEPFLLVNLHGNCLELPTTLKVLKELASCFLVFYAPHSSYDQICEERAILKNFVSPHQAFVELYIDPNSDTEAHISPNQIIKTPFNINEEVNVRNAQSAFLSALSHRPKQAEAYGNLQDIDPDIFPKRSQNMTDLSFFIGNNTVARLKASLIFQTSFKTLDSQTLTTHWTNDFLYSHVITEVAKIFKSPLKMVRKLVIELDELIGKICKEEQAKLQQSLCAFSLVPDEEWIKRFPLVEKSNQAGRLERRIEERGLRAMELVLETLKVTELCPHLLPNTTMSDLIEGLAYMAENSYPIILPVHPILGIFGENWTSSFLEHVNNGRYFVLNAIGTEESVGKLEDILGELFGKVFSRQHSIPSSNLSFQLLNFDEKLKEKTAVEGILLLQSRGLATISRSGNMKYRTADQKLATFLASVANMNLFIDFKPQADSHFQWIIESVLLSLNKLPWKEQIPNFLFVGGDYQQISNFLESLHSSLTSYWEDEGYADISDLGGRALLRSRIFLQERDGILPLYNLILSEAKLEASYGNCKTFQEFATSLQSQWNQSFQNIPFDYANFDQLLERRDFGSKINSVLQFLEASFSYHSQALESNVYHGMHDILDALSQEEQNEDTISFEIRKEILFAKISSNVTKMFRDCEIGDEDEIANCKFCIDAYEKEEEVKGEFEDPALQIKFTEALAKYKEGETEHYLKMVQQMMDAIEVRVELETEKNFKVEEFTKIQELSLKRRVIPTNRRMASEMQEMFPHLKLEVGENGLSLEDIFQKVPAYEYESEDDLSPNGGDLIGWEEGAWLEFKLTPIAKSVTSGVSLYATGIVRETRSKVEKVFKEFQEINASKILMSGFKRAIMFYCLGQVSRILVDLENDWLALHDPLTIYKNRHN